MNQISNILQKLEAGVKQCERWMIEWDRFFFVLEQGTSRNLPVWPLRWLHNFSDFRSKLKKIVNFQNMNWLDGVGIFHKDEVYRSGSLFKTTSWILEDSRLSMCLSPSGRFLFVEPEKKNKESLLDWQMNRDIVGVTMQMGVIDLLLGEYYRLDIDCLSEVSPLYLKDDFIGFYALTDSTVIFLDYNPFQENFRQRLISIDHHRRKAQCPGHRVFQRQLASTSFRHGSQYCAIYDDGVIRFAKDPTAISASTKDGSLTIGEDFQTIHSRKFFFSDTAAGDLFFPVFSGKRVRIFERGDILEDPSGSSFTFETRSTAFFRYSFDSLSFSIQTAAFNERGFPSGDEGPALLKQQGSSMVYSQPEYSRPRAYRVLPFFNHLLVTCALTKVCLHQIFECPHAFSYLFYYRLVLFYIASACAEELYSCLRKIPVNPIMLCAFDTRNWRWVNCSKACGSQDSVNLRGHKSSIEVCHFHLQHWPIRFPNVALRRASRALIQQLKDSTLTEYILYNVISSL
uniref:ShKT domain-containing protein n=1 Tax=Ditylenchus dipsaci TaxID=166011 RepID=A0A915CMC5_9BILA